MQCYPSTAEAKLGFDVLRSHLEGYTLGPLGLARIREMVPCEHLDQVQDTLARVSEFQDVLRFDDPVPLRELVDIGPTLRRVAPVGALLSGQELLELLGLLRTMRLVHGYFMARQTKYQSLSGVVDPITPTPHLEQKIEATIDRQGHVRDDASPELRRLRRSIVRKQQALRETVMRALRAAVGQGYATEDQPTLRSGRLVIPVRAEAKRKVQGFIHDTSATGQTVYIEPAAALDLNNEVRLLEVEEQREVERILIDVAAEVRVHLDELRLNLDVLALLDELYARARLANALKAIVPELNTKQRIQVRQGRNPVLWLHFQSQAQTDGASREVVPLDLDLDDTHRTLIITGPNAGGKSVALKTIGLLSLMLAYGMPVPVGPGSSLGLFQRIFVDIGDEQSIEDDLSTFSSHVTHLRHIIAQADPHTLVLIDEAGTGTDPAEGGALAQAVLEHLTLVGARTIVTTHHGTLKAFGHETEGVINGSMQFDHDTLRPTYHFQSGIPGSSFAFEIASRIGLDLRILDRARGLVGKQKTALESLIADFEARNHALEEQLTEAREASRIAGDERARYEVLRKKINANRDELREKALAEAEQIVLQANAAVERTIREIKEAQAEREATRQAREQLEQVKQSVQKRHHKAKRRRKSRPRPAQPQNKPEPAPGPIQVGDQVILDEGGTTAEVAELDGKEAVITFGSMRARVKVKRLRKVAGPRQQHVRVQTVSAPDQTGLRSLSISHTLDLRGQRVEEAIQSLTRFLDEAVVAGLERVDILHGKGTGALRLAVQDFLRASPDVSTFAEAHPDQGGAGVTQVNLV